MRFVEGTVRLSPTDLANHAACAHLTSLDLKLAHGELTRPDDFCLVTEALRRRGEEHERKYVEHLKTQGLSIADLREAGTDANGAEATLRAMRKGIDRIIQAPLLDGNWAGRADVLVRVDTPSALDGPIQETTTNDGVREALATGEAYVAGGTAWLWSREDSIGALDVLFVDEAGQMSLANVSAAGRAARSIVLLGDPQQLEQPLQGSHPDGTAVSVLHHVLGGAKTMPPDRGLFLPETWRLAPSIAAFTSELFYEDRLSSRPGLDVQQLVSPAGFNGSGLWFVPIEHEGNQNESPEEAAAVAGLVRRLIDGHHWVNQKGEQAPLGLDDILIVAPYNAQVGAIQELLPRARVGTVDRFQGQEAAVVIYSLTTSSPKDAPRGMEFLYSLNRLNVATSRARCGVFLVCSPRLLAPDCRTPRQMQLANGVCRYVEAARPQGQVVSDFDSPLFKRSHAR